MKRSAVGEGAEGEQAHAEPAQPDRQPDRHEAGAEDQAEHGAHGRACHAAADLDGLLRPLRGAELSDGTLRYLLWVAALLTPRPPELLVLNEPETVAWFAVRFDDNTFGIFDTFNEESGRRAHLSGPIAEALMSRSAELLEAMPTIRQPDVIADKLPG